jgi:hypothetical protein
VKKSGLPSNFPCQSEGENFMLMPSELRLLKAGVALGLDSVGPPFEGVPNKPCPSDCCFGGGEFDGEGPFLPGCEAWKTSASDSSSLDEEYSGMGFEALPLYDFHCPVRPESEKAPASCEGAARWPWVGELRTLEDRPRVSANIDVRSPAAAEAYGVRTRLPSAYGTFGALSPRICSLNCSLNCLSGSAGSGGEGTGRSKCDRYAERAWPSSTPGVIGSKPFL